MNPLDVAFPPILLTSAWGDWTPGNFTIIDLVAAATNAFNAALISRRPDHWKHYTIVGIILLAVMGGLAGGISRDVLLNDIPSPLTSPWYLIVSLVAGGLAIMIAYYPGQRLREGLFQFATSLALPWYAVVGTAKALDADLPYLSAVLVGLIGATTGRFLVDVTAGLTPKQFIRGEWFVGTAVIASVVYVICDAGFGLSLLPASLISFGVAFVFRYAAMWFHWEEPEPWEPAELKETEVERPRIQDQLQAEFHPDEQVDK